MAAFKKINPSAPWSKDRGLLRMDTESGVIFPRPEWRGLNAAECIKAFAVLGFLALALNGCVFLVAGSVGAVGGYAITRDTLQGDYDVSVSDIYKAAVEVCGALGTVTTRDSGRGLVMAAIDRAKVRVEISQLTPEASRLKVKARKGIFPRLGTAEKVFVKIVQRLT